MYNFTIAKLVSTLSLLLSYANDDYQGLSKKQWEQEYDYVIVGGGSAGSTLAARLSEDSSMRVLLLEAGGSEDIISEVPFLAGNLQRGTKDWADVTVAQKYGCVGGMNSSCAMTHGKVLGGGSTINYMLYVRGNRNDYDQWAELGASGWAWDDVLPYFLKAEDNRNQTLLDEGLHGSGGPLTVSSQAPDEVYPLTKAFLEAGRQFGYPVGDYNGARQSVFSLAQFTIRDGRRCSASKAYLRPSRARKNLDIVTFAQVAKILFSNSSSSEPEARGVLFERKGKMYEVSARREVIVSAGAFNSPKLLMLSGIGPAEHLRDMKIPVRVDLPVGNNLQDHIYPNMWFTVKKGTKLTLSKLASPSSLVQLAAHGRGPLTTPAVEAFGFIKVNPDDAVRHNYTEDSDWPDFQIHMMSTNPLTISPIGGPLFKRAMRLGEQFYERVVKPNEERDLLSLLPALLRPKSRGTVRLQSSNFRVPPLIDPKYLTHPDDVKSMVRVQRAMLELAKMPALREFEPKPIEQVYPGCEKHELYSNAYLECMVKFFVSTYWHYAGTCRMGSLDDPLSVLDARLRVKGVRKLRVADTSVMPTVVSGNTNAAAIMIGERAADLIKEDNAKQA